MLSIPRFFSFCILLLLSLTHSQAQDYYFKQYQPFDPEIPSPEEFLGYGIGEYHSRHDLIVAYMNKLAEVSDRASIQEYGLTYERRKLVMLTISDPANMDGLDKIKSEHLKFVDPEQSANGYDEVPIFIQLGYNVHGNEASGAEAAMLTAYTLIASKHPTVRNYLKNSVVFLDPTLNPDGRERHSQWANQFRARVPVADQYDAEHLEMWPLGRTNHYWFDLNRDWWLGIHPESRGKLNWYHEWYPNVVTDFHEMGTNSQYFFEPMKAIGSKDPIMPRENYEDLNEIFGDYFAKTLDSIGSLYFSKEVFDGTYPGYGSSYPDLQGALALLFEQARSRGILHETTYGKDITFPFTIRNQFRCSMATIEASVENKALLRKYQQDFFKSAVEEKPLSGVKGYEFDEGRDKNLNKAFLDKLLLHRIKFYKKGSKYYVPIDQPQRRLVQSVFETYDEYRDSVFYDASAWSLANFYNLKYRPAQSIPKAELVSSTESYPQSATPGLSKIAYIIDGQDYNAIAAINHLQQEGLVLALAFKPFAIESQNYGKQEFSYGASLIPIQKQKDDWTIERVYGLIKEVAEKYSISIYGVKTGLSSKGIDLGSNNFEVLEEPKVFMLIGEGISAYEAGEVWHLLDTRVGMPITKVRLHTFPRIEMEKYNTLVMVSSSYSSLDSIQLERIKNWVKQGNTLITIGRASKWAIDKKLVKEKLTEKPSKKDGKVQRLPYVSASEHLGREQLGGAIFEVDLDLTHPLGFGYSKPSLAVYKNNKVFLQPSKSPYGTVAKYTENPHIDGYISPSRLENYLKPSASLIVSPIGKGRVIMFADNPNFRGSWYGTNRLFLNALMLGNHIRIPK